jgi:hypothetical protein
MADQSLATGLKEFVAVLRVRAGKACQSFLEYKGGRYCYTCDEADAAHEARRIADELDAIITPPAARNRNLTPLF